jgi:hypothetical protein
VSLGAQFSPVVRRDRDHNGNGPAPFPAFTLELFQPLCEVMTKLLLTFVFTLLATVAAQHPQDHHAQINARGEKTMG